MVRFQRRSLPGEHQGKMALSKPAGPWAAVTDLGVGSIIFFCPPWQHLPALPLPAPKVKQFLLSSPQRHENVSGDNAWWVIRLPPVQKLEKHNPQVTGHGRVLCLPIQSTSMSKPG